MHRFQRGERLGVQRVQVVLRDQLCRYTLRVRMILRVAPRRWEQRVRKCLATHNLEAFDAEVTEQLREDLRV